MSLIRVQNLSFAFSLPHAAPIPVLHHIDLDIQAGEYVALIGANGSGKTTLVRHLNALLQPTAGKVWVDGLDAGQPTHWPAIRAAVGMVLQSPSDQLIATIVQEDVAFGPENLGVGHEELVERVRQALEQVDMWAWRHRPPQMLSAGQQQRIAIAGALALRPRCLILDEATAMLDPAGRRAVLSLMDDLHRAGLTLIAITHDMDEAARAERVVVLSRGQVAMDGSPAQVLSSPQLAALGLARPPAVELADRLRRWWPELPPHLLTWEQIAAAGSRTPVPVDAPLTLSEPDTADATAQETSTPLICTIGLHHTYLAGTPLAQESLRGIDFQVKRGRAAALIGATGSGKSTLLQHLNGLLRPQRGQVWVEQQELGDPRTDLRAIRRRVGLVFQRPGDQVFEPYVVDDIAFGPHQAGLRGDELRRRVHWAMEMAGLDWELYRRRPVFALSGGERRKVGLAGVLALRPEVLLLDEPTAGLDPAARADLLMQLDRWRAESMTLVIATHNMDDIAVLAGDIDVLHNGATALRGPTRQVFAQGDALQSLGLDVPSATAALMAWRQQGWNIPIQALTLDEADAIIHQACLHQTSAT